MAETKKPAEKKKEAKPKDAPAKKVESKEEVKHEHKTEDVKETPKAKEADKKPKKTKKDEKADIVSENVYTVPLRSVFRTRPKYRRTSKAVALLVSYIKKHTKATDVKLDNELNKHLWARGDCKPPRKVQVKAAKDSKGKVTVSLLK